MTFGATNPTTSVVLLETATVEVSVEENMESLFKVAEISKDQENIEFVTRADIDVIQIINEAGEMEFQLPVGSHKVKINKSLFGAGNYKLGFKISGQEDIKYADVELK